MKYCDKLGLRSGVTIKWRARARGVSNFKIIIIMKFVFKTLVAINQRNRNAKGRILMESYLTKKWKQLRKKEEKVGFPFVPSNFL